MNLTQIAKIARREYLARVRNKAFITMTVLVPVFLGLYFLSVPLLSRSGSRTLRVAIVDAGTGLGRPLADRLRSIERPSITVTEVVSVRATDTAARERLGAAVRARTLDGYLLVESHGSSFDRLRTTLSSAEGSAPRARYVARETGDPVLIRELRLAVQSAALEKLLAGTGVDVNEVRKTQQFTLDSVTLSDRGERTGGFQAAFASTMVLGMLLYVAVLINGQGMATAIVEEKSSRLIEVILGAVTATEFMIGKILGVLGSGVTQLAIWIAVALVGLLQASPALGLGASTPGFDLSSVLTVRLIFYFAVFFSLGYLLYSVLFAVVAVTCTSTEELGQTMMAAVLPMVVALMVALSVIANPATPMTRVLSLIPFFTPLVMLARVNVLMPPLWEVWLSVAILIASSAAAGWIAAKIFRYALLMTGKRPTLPELMRVVRAG